LGVIYPYKYFGFILSLSIIVTSSTFRSLLVEEILTIINPSLRFAEGF